jgi:hypothetical protein
MKWVRLVVTSPLSIANWIENADVISEGAASGDSYFGTTSLVLPARLAPELVEKTQWIARDPHLRLRALRIADREARSRGATGTMRTEMTIDAHKDGIVVHIDVEARADLARANSSPLTPRRS